MKNLSNWIKSGLLLAVVMAVVFVMASSGVASVEKLWTEKATVTNQDVSPVGGTLFRGLAEKLSPAVVNVRPMKKVVKTYGNFPYRFRMGPLLK